MIRIMATYESGLTRIIAVTPETTVRELAHRCIMQGQTLKKLEIVDGG